MNFVVKLDGWLEINGLVHVSTTYTLYSDKLLTNLIDTIEDSDKLFLSIKTDIPVGETYYVVATRHFNVENIDYSSEVFAITNNSAEINNMILSEPIVIETPTVIISRKTILDSVDNVIVRTSAYRGRGDGHTHTHWFVYDINGLVFIKLRDVDNKTSIEIPKSLLLGKNKLMFKAIHCSNNIESPMGNYEVNFNRVNFEITTQLHNVPLADYTLGFKKIDNTKPMRLVKVNLLNNYNEVLKVYDITEQSGNTNSIIIEELYLTTNLKLNLELYCYDEVNKITKITKILYPLQDTLENQYIKDYTYLNTIDTYTDVGSNIPLNSVGDIVNGLVLLPNQDKVSSYKFNSDGSFTKVADLNGVTLLNALGKDTYISYTNGYLIIDTYDDVFPTFMVYKHNIVLDTYTLLHTLIRDDVKTVANANNMVQINLDEFIYNPYGGNKLNKYNFKTNVITPLEDIPMNITSSVLIKLEDGRILILGNNTHLTNIYRIEQNDYIDSVSIVPEAFIGVDLKSIELVNRDYLIFVNNGIATDMMYFDRSEYTLTALDINLVNGETNTVIPLNGSIAITGKIEQDYVLNIPEHTILGLYK